MAKGNPSKSNKQSASDSRTESTVTNFVESVVIDGKVVPDPNLVNPPLDITSNKK